MSNPRPDADLCNCLAVRQAARQISQFYDRFMAPTGLRGTQYSILSHIGRRGALSINELAEVLVMDRTTMGRAVRPLERDGLVTIAAGRDGRTRALVLTPAGLEKLDEATDHWQAAQTAFEGKYGGASAATLRSTMRHVVATLADAGDINPAS